MYNCEIVEQTAQPVLSIRVMTSVERLPEWLGKAYSSVIRHLAELKEQPTGAPFAAYHNMDMQNLDVEAGFPVAKILPGKGEITARDIEAGEQARCLHTGPYAASGPVYEALTRYISEKGYTPTGVAFEFYLNEPGQTPEDELQTMIVFPIVPR
ncbi:MAG: GyrI-like domain-containing protein [Bacillota bacterium]|nr:GyrI-like domain-containing protein [Bacillota bacterium]